MTETQYLLGWIVYLAGGTGCMIGLWLVVRYWNTRFKRFLMALFAVLVYLPGMTKSDMSFMGPAFLTTLYDALTYDPQAALRNGKVVAAVALAASLMALALPVKKPKKSRDPHKTLKPGENDQDSNDSNKRKEPVY